MKAVQEDLIDKIIETKAHMTKVNSDSFFDEKIKGKSKDEICEFLKVNDDIVELLLSEETKDDGGIIALSGFYFQFLVSIEYLIELINGEWDYLLIDHHQDIIVLNSKRIRIIQVKTKNVPYADVSDTGTYNDWVQKLFILDKMFEGYEQKREFELVTNFIIKNSPTVEVEIYRGNDSFDMVIQKNSFFDKVKGFSEAKGYSNLLDEAYLQELLSKFKITSNDTKGYVPKITSMIGSLFGERINGTKEDIDYLIGYICSVCYYPEYPSIQLIDKEKGERIYEELSKRVGSEVRDYVKNEDSLEKINNYIEYLHSAVNDSPLYNQLSTCISEFESELKENIRNSNNIYGIVSRFTERVNSSYKYRISKKDFIDEYIKELLDLTFFIKFSSGGKVTLDYENRKLLLKVIGNNKYNFFNLRDIDNHITGVSKFIEIFKGCKFEEKRLLFDRNELNLIFSGSFDDEDFPNEYIIELDCDDNPTEEDMKAIGVRVEHGSIAKVTHKVQVKNGSNNVKTKFFRKRMLPTIEEYREHIKGQIGW
ncbi:dsDNA nuclease domain-containing protein [Bacillus sp. REN16]|uniref:dsDNA nuclease domain-containing protein n=1 Tax=Bacillus sp. REN16 TaxID=2887296 RepID=UPI001E3630E5|nr:dsDNA nuclease domain-containing protein [Bacillus sp. REN16]MCC3359551.1 DUF4297 domain-containing protein [Bacillus sp. REN16]